MMLQANRCGCCFVSARVARPARQVRAPTAHQVITQQAQTRHLESSDSGSRQWQKLWTLDAALTQRLVQGTLKPRNAVTLEDPPYALDALEPKISKVRWCSAVHRHRH